jgi:3-deoxy-7-phosphoheptulonate synthase
MGDCITLHLISDALEYTIFKTQCDLTMSSTEDLNIQSAFPLMTPNDLKNRIPASEAAMQTVTEGRETIKAILDRNDPRIFVVIGPCSIHDTAAAMDYAKRLKALSEELNDTLYIVMRAYFEKPRTTVGWKGLINDPFLDDSFAIEDGLQIARKLLIDLSELGLPLATEALDPISPQYIQDLIAWSAIGARTTESQTHREMSSGLSCPVGFKNGTDGGLEVAINALGSVAHPHRFLGINSQGEVSIIKTKGNQYGHIVLRGGSNGPNFDSVHVALAEQELTKAGLKPNIMIDTSHANSNKDHNQQPLVLNDIAHQIADGNTSIVGIMIESNIGAGNQKVPADKKDLIYGVSITDKCIDWETTEKSLRHMRDTIKAVIAAKK